MSRVTKRQAEVMMRVVETVKRNVGAWYRAESSGERVTLASLHRAGLLHRRVWRGKGPDAAHEYRPTAAFLDFVEAQS